MVIFESIMLGAAYKYTQHRKHKKERESQAAITAPNQVYPYYADPGPPPSHSTANLATPAPSSSYASTQDLDWKPSARALRTQPSAQTLMSSYQNLRPQPTPQSLHPMASTQNLYKKPSTQNLFDYGVPKTLSKLAEQGTEWRPVYMLERSISKNRHNNIRTHRALFVGELVDGQITGRAHEIRKDKSSSLFGMQIPWERTMSYTDAEEWVGAKDVDRDPVFLGYTDWTDEELNREGHNMVDDYPSYSINYSNCQHFVADLAVKIIPQDHMNDDGMAQIVPTFDKFMDQISNGDYKGHGDALFNGAAALALGTVQQTTKFFHFTRAVMKSLAKLDWRPFDEYNRLLRNGNMRRLGANALEAKRRGPMYLTEHSTGSSNDSSTSNLGSLRNGTGSARGSMQKPKLGRNSTGSSSVSSGSTQLGMMRE